MAFTIRQHETIVQAIANRVVATTGLTDLNTSSALYQLIAAVSFEVHQAYVAMAGFLSAFGLDTAAGTELDERAREIGGLTRAGVSYATGTLTFSRPGTTGAITIPAGTIVQKADGSAQARTLLAGTINNGDTTSGTVNTVSITGGTAGNGAAGSYSVLVTRVPGVTSVTSSAFVDGEDRESDAAFRDRIRRFVRSLARCHRQALEAIALTVVDPALETHRVRFAQIVEDHVDRGNVVLYIDDGTGLIETTTDVVGEAVLPAALGGEQIVQLDNYPVKTAATYTIYVDAVALVEGTDYEFNPADGKIYLTTALIGGAAVTADYTYYTGLIAETQKTMDGDPADSATYPGAVAAGVRLRVLPPTIIPITVTGTLTVTSGRSDAAEAAETAVVDYINTLGIGEHVIRNELIQRIMEVPNVVDVDLTLPTENITILDGQLARVLGDPSALVSIT